MPRIYFEMVPMIELVDILSGHSGKVWSVDWTFDGRALASCGEDKVVRIWTFVSDRWECTETLEGQHQRTIRRVAWSPNANYLACCAFDGSTSVYKRSSVGGYQCVASLEGHENEVKAVAWSSCGTLLATCGRDKSIWVWELGDYDEFDCAAVLHGHSQDVKSIRFHPQYPVLFSCSYDDTIKVWAEEELDWFCASTLTAHKSTVWDLCFTENGNQFVSCSDDRQLILWKKDTEKEMIESREGEYWLKQTELENAHSRCIYSVSCSAGSLIASAGGDNAIHLYKIGDMSLENIAKLPHAHKTDINCVSFSPDGKQLASCADDGEIKIWKIV